MNIVIVEPPEAPAVSLEEIYSFLRLDPSGSPLEHPDDAMLTEMLKAATAKVEAATNRALVPQTIRLILPAFSADGIELKRSPLIEVVAVKYLDAAGDEQTMDAALYTVSAQALVPLLKSSAWPSTIGRSDAAWIEYRVGYPETITGDPASGVPAGLKAAVKFEVQLQYDDLTPEKRQKIEDTIARLLGQYRIHTF